MNSIRNIYTEVNYFYMFFCSKEIGCSAAYCTRLPPPLTLRSVPRGLALRPYTRVVLATPGWHPQPLDADLLAAWPEARLVLTWRNRRSQTKVGALFAVGDDGPAPAVALRSRGWHAWIVPDRFVRRWSRTALPTVPVGTAAHDLTPQLLLAKPTIQPAAVAVVHQPDLDNRLSNWLTLLLERPTLAVEETERPTESTDSSIWPTGPDGMPPATLGRLIEQILAEPRFQSTRKGQSGITKGRLTSLNTPGITDALARTLMVWFDRAEILAKPIDGQGLWRAPRPFAIQDLVQIAQQLRATPLPSSAEVQDAYGGER